MPKGYFKKDTKNLYNVAVTKTDCLNVWWYLGWILDVLIVLDRVRLGLISSEIKCIRTLSDNGKFN